jgi:4-hydroxyphenylpyruvate dioxygenase
MDIAINQSVLMNTPLEEFLDLCRESDVHAVELQINSVRECTYRTSSDAIRRKLDQCHVSVLSLNSLRDFSLVPEENLVLLASEARLAGRLCSIVGANTIVVSCARTYGRSFSEDEIVSLTVDRINLISEVLAEYDVNVAFEPVAYHDYSVQSLTLADEIVSQTASSNNGLVVDVYNLFPTGIKPDEIGRTKSRIHLIHVNDVEWFPDKDLHVRRTRTFPGDGRAGPEYWAKEAICAGYSGAFSLEIFPEDLWQLPAKLVMYKTVRKMERFKDVVESMLNGD